MTDLSTTYMGLPIQSPLISSAGPQNLALDNLIELEEMGIGAVVMPSLFEEQINVEDAYQTYQRHLSGLSLPDPLKHLATMKNYNKGTLGYLSLLGHVKKNVNVPIIASLNGVSTDGWVQYARVLAEAGADGLELNTYFLPNHISQTSQQVESGYLHLVEAIRINTHLPLAVKISPYISALPAFVKQLEDAGANAVVLFNRFYEPDIDIFNEAVVPNLDLSTSADLRLRLRWSALIHKQVNIDIAVTGGIHNGYDLAKTLLVGGQVGMTTSALLQRGIGHAKTMLGTLRSWMLTNGHSSLAGFRGKLSHRTSGIDPAFLRANYIQELKSYTVENMA